MDIKNLWLICMSPLRVYALIHRDIYVSVREVMISWNNDLLPDRYRYIVSTNAAALLTGLMRTIFCDIKSKYDNCQTRKSNFKMWSSNWRCQHVNSFGLVTPYDSKQLGQHCPRQWFLAWRHRVITRKYTSHYYGSLAHLKVISQQFPIYYSV